MNENLAEQVGKALKAAGKMVAVAESSTGGLVGSKITDVPGASEYFDRSVVTYSNAAKIDLLGVKKSTLEAHGAVSEAVAEEMAAGARDGAGSAWGVSTTGIAGPSGGTDEKPVGTVFIGISHSEQTTATRYEFDGSRLDCKEQFAEQALADLLAEIETKHGEKIDR